MEKDGRDIYRERKLSNAAVKFRENWTQMSSDPKYQTKKLSHFVPMACEIYRRPPYVPVIIQEHS